MASTITRYVNPDSSGGNGTTNATSGANAAYASLATALSTEVAARPNLVSNDEILDIICETGGSADTTAVNTSGFTTDATRYLSIRANTGHRHSGTWNTAKYRVEVANVAAVFGIKTDYCRIDGLQIRLTSANANDQMALTVGSVDTSDIRISNCITRVSSGSSFRQTGIWIVDAQATVTIWNHLDYDHPSFSSVYNTSIFVEAASAVRVYSCTLIGGFYGLRSDSGTTTVKNTYASTNDAGNGGAAFFTGGGTFNQTTTASSDATATGSGLDNIAVNTTTFTNVTSGSEDFHLPAGSPLLDVGTDTSGESAPLNFTTDIDGETRTGTWDIGADSRETGGGGTAASVFYMHRLTQGLS